MRSFNRSKYACCSVLRAKGGLYLERPAGTSILTNWNREHLWLGHCKNYHLPFIGVASGHFGMLLILRPTLCCSTGIHFSTVMPATLIHKQDHSGRWEHIKSALISNQRPCEKLVRWLTIHGRSPSCWNQKFYRTWTCQKIKTRAHTHTYIILYAHANAHRYMVSGSVFLPPQWYGFPGSTPFPSIWKLLAEFLRSSLEFARSLQHFWLPASHLLGTCYLLDDLRSTHTPSKYLRATYSHIYMCYVYTSSLLPVYSHNTTCV